MTTVETTVNPIPDVMPHSSIDLIEWNPPTFGVHLGDDTISVGTLVYSSESARTPGYWAAYAGGIDTGPYKCVGRFVRQAAAIQRIIQFHYAALTVGAALSHAKARSIDPS